jgi:23S rRNA pseudouridine1911/1915/1917 synthase
MDHVSLTVLYEDPNLVAVDKPAGIHTAPISENATGTLLALIIARYPEIARVPGIKPVESGLLHRLDRLTSGVVVAARSEAAFHSLRRQFEEGIVRKEYCAVCRVGAAAEDGILAIESRFAPYGPGRKKVRVIREEDLGRPRSREATVATYFTEARIERRQGNLALVRACIRKGFRHQVRAHLSALGLPIIGDPLYGEPAPGPTRMFLHACRVVLESPTDGARIEIRSPPPPEFLEVLARA